MISKYSLSRRSIAWLCALLLLVSILPLYALALYNHAFYDDFGFSIVTHEAWTQTHHPFAVLEAAVRNTVGIRQTWEGTYTTSFISALQPAVFGEGAYWVTTFLLLTVFLLAVWVFLRQTLCGVYGADRHTAMAVFGILGFVLVQFVPDAAEAFYWYNGGVAYTLLWSVMLFTATVWLRLDHETRPGRAVWLALLAAVLTVLVGGAKYSTALFASLMAVCFTGWSFWRKRPKRWLFATLTLLLLAGLLFSVTAPGNAERAQTLGGGISPAKAVLESLYFGFALIGHSFSLPLVAALLLVVALAVPALRESGLPFSHPVWVTGISVCLFCAQLTPTLYTGNYLGDGRVLNTYHYTLVLMTAQIALYWTGWYVRRRECGLAPVHDAIAALPHPEPASVPLKTSGGIDPSAEALASMPADAPRSTCAIAKVSPETAPGGLPAGDGRQTENRLKAITLAIIAVFLLMGCMAYHPEGSLSYGPQNMTGGSALRSLVTGEAAAYDAAMDKRDALLTDASLTDVALPRVSEAPELLMGDSLDSENLDYVLRLYAEYYHKATVQVAEAEATHAP